MDLVVGVDLGGTNVRAQAFGADGSPAGQRVEMPSRAQEGFEATADAVCEAVLAACPRPRKVGMAVPGHIDAAAGVVRWAPNFGRATPEGFAYWEDAPLGDAVQKGVGAAAVLGNDANCAALGEYRFGSGRGTAACLVMVTVGTGIGGGVVLGAGSVWGGSPSGPMVLLGGNQGGAELGHLCLLRGGLDCNAGSYGAFEAYCQRDAIVARARHKLRRGRESSLRALDGQIEPRDIAAAADAGDELAQEVWDEVGAYLGAGLGSLINVFAPDVLAVGGQIAKAGEWLLGPARREARNVAIPSLFRECRIVPAEQGEDAGLLGAAALALG
jgi:glucokinase